MEELISVIVPIYNVEKYLDKCITSVQNQTYKKLEIILVDDGSPDNCGKLCDIYSQSDKRIKVIHKKNGGLSDARNKGIDIATGKYIVFIDSDDYVANDYVRKLYEAIKKENALISQCNILKINDAEEIIEKIGYDNCYLKNGKELIMDIYNGHLIENVVVWNKMYSIELFKEIRFPVGRINEDEFTTYKIFYNTPNIAIINQYLYRYRQNPESIMGKMFNVKRLDLLNALKERLEFFKSKNETEIYEKTLNYYLEQLRVMYIKSKSYILDKDIEKKILKEYKEKYLQYVKLKNISIMKKLKSTFFYFCPDIFYLVKKGKIK